MSGKLSQESKDAPAGSTSGATSDERYRIWVGIVMVGASLVGIFVLAGLSIGFAEKSNQDDTIKELFSSLLPVLSMWVGTILAFYFSKENFAAAAQQATALVKQLTPEQRLQTIAVSDVMIPMGQAKAHDWKEGETPKTPLKLLLGELTDSNYNRLPIVDPSTGQVKYVIHRSLMDRFIATKALESSAPGAAGLTLADLIKDERIGRTIAGFSAVASDAKLNAVKAQMDGNRDCDDVFVTQDGTKGGRAIGWITNVIVAERSKL
jgi:hypothetical protein